MSRPDDKAPEGSPPRRRRSLTNVGGRTEIRGEEDIGRDVEAALDVPSADDDDGASGREHVHGFHAYPARMHPLTAERLIACCTDKGQRVVDPFAGSGTVLVSAMLQGRHSAGFDLNPLAVRLARLKTRPFRPAELSLLVEQAELIAEFAEERRKAKAGALGRAPKEDVALFAPHVLLELSSLRGGIGKLEPSPVQEALRLVLSSILVKLSQRKADTSVVEQPKRIAAGYPARLFVKKASELADSLNQFRKGLGPRAPSCEVYESDGTKMAELKDAQAHAVITSPPYPGTYDYLEHHAMRLRWLGLPQERFAEGELGARRHYEGLGAEEARARYRAEVEQIVRGVARVLLPGGHAVLLMADSATISTDLRADVAVEQACDTLRTMRCVTFVSQDRPHFHAPTARWFRQQPKREHVLVLKKGA